MNSKIFKNAVFSISFTLCFALVLLASCRKSDLPIIDKALSDKSSMFYIDFASYPSDRKALPIGVFDSGTGGLTVLEKILVCDEFDNATGEEKPDGKPDFSEENFTYLGDIANMPYGNYAAENKADYLRELVIRDASFFLKDQPSKIIVVACNTATAYGLADIAALLRRSRSGIKVIGVINAGVKATLQPLDRAKDYAIGVMATPGTIASGAYERTINEMKTEMGFSGRIFVVNQPGRGFAESVDGEKDFTDVSLASVRPTYRGPVLGSGADDIKPDLMNVYRFDTDNNALLIDSLQGQSPVVQLNSAGNYARFHLVSLLEQYRASGHTTPISRIILGCTHYPFLLDTLKVCIAELKSYQKDEKYLYRSLIADDLEFIDPALFTAKECYATLKADGELLKTGSEGSVRAFFSIPAPDLSPDKLNPDGTLKYEFKYGRTVGQEEATTLFEPYSHNIISPEIRNRLQLLTPKSYFEIEK